MPINMRTHAHGQGYADINFLIPELIGSMTIRKGPYFADQGDFSSAGALHIDYLDRLDPGLARSPSAASAIAACWPQNRFPPGPAISWWRAK